MPSDLRTGIDILSGGAGEWEVIVKYNGSLAGIPERVGGRAEPLGDNYAILTLPAARIPELYRFNEIEYLELPKTLTFSMRESLGAVCVPEAQRRYGLAGKGVIIGVIDSGLDYTHPDFRNADGSTRILSLWDQSGALSPPEGFFHGTEYSGAQIDAALNAPDPLSIIPDMDVIGHGTAVTGVAAGNGRASGGIERGVAPEASLIIVKLDTKPFAKSTAIMRGLKYLTDRAAGLGMPIAINISFGTNNGSHSGNSLFETYIDAVCQRWKTVVAVATGNEAFEGHHHSGRAAVGKRQDITFTTGSAARQLFLSMWKSFTDTFDITLTAPDNSSTGALNPTEAFRQFVLGGVAVSVFYGQPTFYNELQEVYIQLDARGPMPSGLWTLTVTGATVVDGDYQIWLPTTEESGGSTAFSVQDPSITLTLPSSAANVISVGGFDASNNTAAVFSGRGYTYIEGNVKPDITAPAVGVLTARAGGGYGAYTGTSFAAPFAAGAAALIMEWGIVRGNDPFLYGQRVKAFLRRTAQRNDRESYPNPIWGYGRLCLNRALDALNEYRS
ncbi:MAG: S8 family serine peptidase [Clostridiales bacterium]|jgi:subtilisin family serine protease|nr:S8 family serine peptidase [Clostridiales bacterium]